MSWVFLAFCSALLLGVYDYFKKVSVRENAVLPVLFLSNLTGALVWLPVILCPLELRAAWLPDGLNPSPISMREHLFLLGKSGIVSCAWIFSYFSLKHLPLSIAAPIRSTAPVWTLIIAVGLLGESPNGIQGSGIFMTLASFWFLSAGKKNEQSGQVDRKWIIAMVLSTLFNACSGIYDKYLLQNLGFTPATVQAWFAIYLAVIMLPFFLGWHWRFWARRSDFQWRWSIPLIAITLLVADFLYFTALSNPDAMVAVITPIRRCSVLVAFALGILILKEPWSRKKGWGLAGILSGVGVIYYGTYAG